MIRIVSHLEAKPVLRRRTVRLTEAEQVVRPILSAVETGGDAALLDYARRFDQIGDQPLRIPQEQLAAAAKRLTPAIREAVEVASRNIAEFAKVQLPKEFIHDFGDGRKLGQIVRPL